MEDGCAAVDRRRMAYMSCSRLLRPPAKGHGRCRRLIQPQAKHPMEVLAPTFTLSEAPPEGAILGVDPLKPAKQDRRVPHW
jgi:hypothetical protein